MLGSLYVVNGPANPPLGNGHPNVSIYLPGAVSPSKVIQQFLQSPTGVAVDKAGNIFISDQTFGQVYELKKKGNGILQPLNLQNIVYPEGLAFDKNGNLWVADYSEAVVNEYAPGQTTPSTTLSTGLSEPFSLAFGAGGVLLHHKFRRPRRPRLYAGTVTTI